jgi:hypothetical protein
MAGAHLTGGHPIARHDDARCGPRERQLSI